MKKTYNMGSELYTYSGVYISNSMQCGAYCEFHFISPSRIILIHKDELDEYDKEWFPPSGNLYYKRKKGLNRI